MLISMLRRLEREQHKNIYVGEYKVKFHQFLQDTNNPNNSIFFSRLSIYS